MPAQPDYDDATLKALMAYFTTFATVDRDSGAHSKGNSNP
jgi:hypothetical protein